MKLETIFLRQGSAFSDFIGTWATNMGIKVEPYEYKPSEDQLPHGLLLINENQDIRRDIYEIHAFFDKKHIPTQKIDLNGTLQVAINSFRMWANSNKCSKVLILGDDDLLKNENLERFLTNL